LPDSRVIHRHVDHLQDKMAKMTKTVSDDEDDWVYNPTLAPTIVEPEEVQRPPQPPPRAGQQPGRFTRIRHSPDQYGFPPSD